MPYQNRTKRKKILVTGSTSPRSTMLTVRAVPSPRRLLGSARPENYTGPTQMPLELLSLILRREKPNRLSKTSGISRGSTVQQKVPQRFRILTNMFFFVPLETEIKLECGKERKSFNFFFPHDKIAYDEHCISGEESKVSLPGLMERWESGRSCPKVAGLAVTLPIHKPWYFLSLLVHCRQR